MAIKRKFDIKSILKKYKDEMFYCVRPLNIFQLFDIDPNLKGEEIKKQMSLLKTVYHPDVSITLTLEEEFIRTEIEKACKDLDFTGLSSRKTEIDLSGNVRFIETEEEAKRRATAESERKFEEYKRKVSAEKLRLAKMNIDQRIALEKSATEDFYTRLQEFVATKSTKINEEKEFERFLPLIERMNNLIVSIDINSGKDLYTIFGINRNKTAAEIKESEDYKLLLKIANELTYDNFKKKFPQSYKEELFKKAISKIAELESILKDEKTKESYDQRNNADFNNFMAEIMTCSQRYLTQSRVVDPFEVFGFDHKKSNIEITMIDNKRHRSLMSIFKKENLSIVPEYYQQVFLELVDLFNELNIKYLYNDVAREDFERELTKETAHNKVEIAIKEEIKSFINNFNSYYIHNSFLNYYEFYKLDITNSRDAIINSSRIRHLDKIFNEENLNLLTDMKDKTTFIKLIKMYKSFKDWTLSTDERKKQYDEEVLKHNKVKYTYQEKYTVDSKGKTNAIGTFEKIIEQSIVSVGTSETLTGIITFLSYGMVREDLVELQKLKSFKQDYLLNELRNYIGEELSIHELVKSAIDLVITRKRDVLKEASLNTVNKRGEKQALSAIDYFYNQKVADRFSRSDTSIGRKEVLEELSPALLRIAIGAELNEEYGYLLEEVKTPFRIKADSQITKDYVKAVIMRYGKTPVNNKRI